MRDIEFCPECGAPVVGDDTSQMCTSCGLTYDEMEEFLDHDDIIDDDEIDPNDGTENESDEDEDADEYEYDEDSADGDW